LTSRKHKSLRERTRHQESGKVYPKLLNLLDKEIAKKLTHTETKKNEKKQRKNLFIEKYFHKQKIQKNRKEEKQVCKRNLSNILPT